MAKDQIVPGGNEQGMEVGKGKNPSSGGALVVNMQDRIQENLNTLNQETFVYIEEMLTYENNTELDEKIYKRYKDKMGNLTPEVKEFLAELVAKYSNQGSVNGFLDDIYGGYGLPGWSDLLISKIVPYPGEEKTKEIFQSVCGEEQGLLGIVEGYLENKNNIKVWEVFVSRDKVISLLNSPLSELFYRTADDFSMMNILQSDGERLQMLFTHIEDVGVEKFQKKRIVLKDIRQDILGALDPEWGSGMYPDEDFQQLLNDFFA